MLTPMPVERKGVVSQIMSRLPVVAPQAAAVPDQRLFIRACTFTSQMNQRTSTFMTETPVVQETGSAWPFRA